MNTVLTEWRYELARVAARLRSEDHDVRLIKTTRAYQTYVRKVRVAWKNEIREILNDRPGRFWRPPPLTRRELRLLTLWDVSVRSWLRSIRRCETWAPRKVAVARCPDCLEMVKKLPLCKFHTMMGAGHLSTTGSQTPGSSVTATTCKMCFQKHLGIVKKTMWEEYHE